MSNNSGAPGFLDQRKVSSEYNQFYFQVSQILASRNYCALVEVMAVTSAGELAVAGTIDVRPCVNQLDADGNAIPHGIVNDLIYSRMQGGGDAVIMDPKVGDIGIAIFADRDISSVKATRARGNPGSDRRADMADGMYMGGILNGIPTQYIRFSSEGIRIHSPIAILMDAPEIELRAPLVEINASTSTIITTPQFKVIGASTLDGPVIATSTIVANTSVTAPLISGTTEVKYAGKNATTHKHGGVTTGTGITGVTV